MTGIVSGGISFGTLILPPVLTQMLSSWGWRITYIILGIVILIVNIIALIFFKNSPVSSDKEIPLKKDKSKISPTFSGMSLKQALRTYQFWLTVLIYFCFGVTQLTVMVHIVPYATGINIPAINAAGILSVIGGVSLAGRIIMGMVCDKLQVKRSAIICLLFMTVACIWLQQADNAVKLYIFAVIFGFGYGGLSCLQSLMAAELFGLLSVGVITAIFSFCFDIGGAIGPVMAGYMFDIKGNYIWAFAGCLVLSSIALIISFSLKSPRKSNDNI
jgi:predicted MFS family arabinose efflux permease